MKKIIILCLFLILVVSCKTYKPITIQGQPDECNDFYSVMSYYYSLDKIDSAFVGTVYNECKQARTEKRKCVREAHCKQLFYGNSELDKTNYQKYSQYLECVKN